MHKSKTPSQARMCTPPDDTIAAFDLTTHQVHGDMKKLCVQMDLFMRTSTFPLYDDVRECLLFCRDWFCASKVEGN